MPSAIQRELALLVTGKDVSATKTLNGVSRQISGLERHSSKAARNVGRNIERGVVIGAGAAAVALGFAVKSAMDWESAVAGVAKTVDGDVSEIADGILDMSRKIPIAADELAGLAETAGALGVAKGDILAFTEVAATLGVTTNVSAQDAATALGQLSVVMGLSADDAERFGSALVDLGNKGNSTEAQILEIARRAGGTGKLLEMATEQTLGWAAAFANLGMQPELAGTAMQKFFQQSLRLVNSKEGLGGLSKIAGMTGKSFKKAFDEDASGALERFIQGLGKMPKDARLSAIDDLFGKTSGLGRALLGLAESYDKNLAPSIDTSTAAWKANNAMQVEAEKRYATTPSKIALLQNNVKAAAITIGSKLLPMLADLSVDAVGWIDEHQDDIEKFATDLRDGIKDTVRWAKQLDWDAIATALQAGAGAAKALVSAFLSLPPELLALLAGGFAVNKLTGGVVVDIATDALKELVFARGASPANPMWVKQVGMPGGGMPGAGGAAGGLGMLSKVFLVGEAIGLAMLVDGVRNEIANASTAQATAIQDQTSQWLAAQPNRDALESGLRAVDKGIADLKSNPLHVLVQGEALNKLEEMRAAIRAQIAASTNPSVGNFTDPMVSTALRDTFDRAIVPTTAAVKDTTGAVDTTRGSVDSMSGKLSDDIYGTHRAVDLGASQTVTGIAGTTSATVAAGTAGAAATALAASQIVAAIRAFKPVTVSPTTIERTTVVQNRTGTTGGSRYQGGSGVTHNGAD